MKPNSSEQAYDHKKLRPQPGDRLYCFTSLSEFFDYYVDIATYTACRGLYRKRKKNTSNEQVTSKIIDKKLIFETAFYTALIGWLLNRLVAKQFAHKFSQTVP